MERIHKILGSVVLASFLAWAALPLTGVGEPQTDVRDNWLPLREQ